MENLSFYVDWMQGSRIEQATRRPSTLAAITDNLCDTVQRIDDLFNQKIEKYRINNNQPGWIHYVNIAEIDRVGESKELGKTRAVVIKTEIEEQRQNGLIDAGHMAELKQITKVLQAICIESAIRQVDITAIHALTEKLPEKTRELKEKLNRLHSDVHALGLSRIMSTPQSEQIDRKWNDFQNKINDAVNEKKRQICLSGGGAAWLGIFTLGIGVGIKAAVEAGEVEEVKREAIQANIRSYSDKLSQLDSNIRQLKEELNFY